MSILKKTTLSIIGLLLLAFTFISCSPIDPIEEATYVRNLYVWNGTSWGQVGGGTGGAYGINVETLADNKVLTPGTDEIYQYLDEGGANRTVTLVTTGAIASDIFVVRHNGIWNDTHYLEVKQGAVTLDRLYAGTIHRFIFDGVNWVAGENLGGESDDKKKNTQIGALTNGYGAGVAIGYQATGYTYGTAIGAWSQGYNYGMALGYATIGYDEGVGIGQDADGHNYAIAIGRLSNANAKKYSIALGHTSETERTAETSININPADTDQENNVVQGRWCASTANNNPTEIFLGEQASQRFTIRASSVLAFNILVTARDNTANEVARYSVNDGLIKRDGANNTAMVLCTVSTDYEDDAGWDCTVTADDANEALIITVTGDAANTVQWAAVLDGVETHF